MSEGYTPTTEQVRNIYANEREEEFGWDGESDDQTIFKTQAEFDRWLAEIERAAADKAWDEGHGYPCDEWVDSRMCDEYHVNPYRRKEQQ